LIVLGGILGSLYARSQLPDPTAVAIENTPSPTEAPSTPKSMQPSQTATLIPSTTQEITASATIEDTPTSTEISVENPTAVPPGEAELRSLETISVENVDTLTELKHIPVAQVEQIQWSLNGQLAAVSGEFGLQVWDRDFSNLLFSLDSEEIQDFDLHPDGQMVAIKRSDNRVEIWNVLTGALVSQPELIAGWITSLAWSPTGDTLGISISPAALAFYQHLSDSLFYIDAKTDQVSDISWSPDGKFIATANHAPQSIEHFIEIWDVDSRTRQRGLSAQPYGRDVSWSPNGKYLAFYKHIYDTSFWNVTARLDFGHSAWSADGAIAAGSLVDNLTIWDSAAWEAKQIMELPVDAIAFSPDGLYFAVSDESQIFLFGVPSSAGDISPSTEETTSEALETPQPGAAPIQKNNLHQLALLDTFEGYFSRSFETGAEEQILIYKGDSTAVTQAKQKR